MKRIISIFIALLLPTLPAFGASSEFGSFKGFEQTYDSCRIDVNSDSMSLEISNLPEKYQTMYKNHAKETVTTATQGKCNGVAYTCKPGDLVTCNPCEMFFYFQEIKELYIENTIEEKCGHLKKTTNKTNSTATTTKQNTKTEPENNFDFAAASANDMNTTVARSGLGNTPAPEPTTPEKSERQQQIEANIKKATTTPTKPAAEVIFEISAKIEIDNGTLPSNITADISPSTCKPAASKYFSGKNISKGYRCPAGTNSVTFTFLTEDQKAKTKYDIENKTQTINLTGQKKYTLEKPIKFVTKKATCDWSTHYLDSKKNKCVAKSTVKCADDEKVDNAGKCQKNIKVGPMNNSDLEMTQDDINRDNCIRGQDKKHTKFENNKCVCESNDYEMQSDGYCTLKRAKCLKQRNTKYENGRCICTSSDFEMHKDNNCYYTSEALERESDAMEEADYEEELKQQDIETRKKLCTDKNRGNWNEKKEKCECTDKKQFFDDDKGCVDATSEYNTAKQQLDTLKTQYDTKVKEISTK